MKSNELRIGNLIYYGQSIRHVTAIHDSPSRKCVGVDNMLTELDVIQPIPLTPEILEKAGFNLQPQRISIYINGRVKLWMGHNGCIAYLMHQDTNESYWIGECKSLHQLQNLYFALTGEELPIEL